MLIKYVLFVLLFLIFVMVVCVVCYDIVVMVYGNIGSFGDFVNIYNLLCQNGWIDVQIVCLFWGNLYCVVCNDYSGSEEMLVKNVIFSVIVNLCLGKIDVIGYFMGVMLVMCEIDKFGVVVKVNIFIGIVGVVYGLWSCGVYLYNVFNSICGIYGLFIYSLFLDLIVGYCFGVYMYLFKFWVDEINCYGGVCIVDGVYILLIFGEDCSFDYFYGYYQLFWYIVVDQVSLL